MLRTRFAAAVFAGLTACQPAAPAETPATGRAATPADAPAPAAAPPPPAADTLQAVRAFVPAGYQVLDANTGDLNRDAYPDRVLVLRDAATDTATTSLPAAETPRPLLLLLGQPGGGYKLAARNDSVVLCANCGGMMGDPYQAVAIKNGYFSVEHYGGSAWRWTQVTTFKYNPADRRWYLHRHGGESFHATDPDGKTETHVQTTRDFGRVRFEHYGPAAVGE